MTARGRLVSRLVTLFVAVAGLISVGALPANAAGHSRTLQYVALGDSYAAGRGGGSYLNDCKQTASGYPELLDARKHIHLRANASCSGATTFDVRATQVSALTKRTRLVTLTVGANDLGVADVAAACSAGPTQACTDAINMAKRLLAAPPGGASVLARRLARVYKAVAAVTPRAKILVTGYPYLFEPASNPIIVEINNATAALNLTIERTAAAAHAAGIKIQYVDVTAAFAGHGIGSLVPFINVTGLDAYHPNAAGYKAYASALVSALAGSHHRHKIDMVSGLVGRGG